jgi:hypothetical protein
MTSLVQVCRTLEAAAEYGRFLEQADVRTLSALDRALKQRMVDLRT